jgi:hypothetical protein
LKKSLQELGVKGIENAKDIDELRKAVTDLESGALKTVDDEINKLVLSLKNMSEESSKTKTEIDKAKDSLQDMD